MITDAKIMRNRTLQARGGEDILAKVATDIEKHINTAALGGLFETDVYTGRYSLTIGKRCAINMMLTHCGYCSEWHCAGKERERIHIWWGKD
jgi:hypothetical protein